MSRPSLEDRLARLDPAQRAALAARLSAARAGGTPLTARPGSRERSPLGMDQERLWILDRMFPGTITYTLGFGLRFLGDLDIEVFRRAVDAVVARHELLRCGIEVCDDRPYLQLHPGRRAEIVVADLPGPPGQAEKRRAAFIESQVRRVFDLRTDPVLRIGIGCLGNGDFQIVETMPHSFTDQWSYVRMNRELLEFYRAFLTGDQPDVPDLPVQFGDYAAWQREYFAGPGAARHRDFWRDYLADAPLLPLPYDHSPDTDDRAGAHYGFVLADRSAAAFLRAAAEARVSAANATLAAYVALLFEETGERDIVVGTPSVTRSQPAVADLVGFLLTNVPVRVHVPEQPTPRALLAAVSAATAAAADHREVPFGEIVRSAMPGRSAERYPIMQTMLVHLNIEESVSYEVPGAQVYANGVPEGISSMDLTVSCWVVRDTMYGRMEYRTALFEKPTIERLAQRLVELIELFGTAPDTVLIPGRRPAVIAPGDPGALVRRRAAEAWTAVLGTPPAADSRFADSGTGLHAVRLSQLLTAAGYLVPPRSVLAHGTFEALVEACTEVDATVLRGPLSPSQEDVLEAAGPPGSSHVVVQWPGPVDTGRLAAAVRAVVAAHPALSTVVHGTTMVSGQAWRWTTVAAGTTVASVQAAHHEALNPGAGATFLVTHIAGEPHRTVLSASTLFVDDRSWNIVLDDLALAYDGEALVPEPVSVLRHAAAVRRIDVSAQIGYWRAVAGEVSPAPPARSGTVRYLERVLPAGRRPSLSRLVVAVGRALSVGAVMVRTDGRTAPPGEPGWDPDRAVGRYTVEFPMAVAPWPAPPDGGLGYGLLRHSPDPVVRAEFAGRPAVCVDVTAKGRDVRAFGAQPAFFGIEISMRDGVLACAWRAGPDPERVLDVIVQMLTAAPAEEEITTSAAVGVSEEYMERLFARLSRDRQENT